MLKRGDKVLVSTKLKIEDSYTPKFLSIYTVRSVYQAGLLLLTPDGSFQTLEANYLSLKEFPESCIFLERLFDNVTGKPQAINIY